MIAERVADGARRARRAPDRPGRPGRAAAGAARQPAGMAAARLRSARVRTVTGPHRPGGRRRRRARRAGLRAAPGRRPAGRSPCVEREPVPGGRAGRLDRRRLRVRHRPDRAHHARPDRRGARARSARSWPTGSTLTPLDPAYRAYFPDGSTLDVITDPPRMAAEIARVCGPREADGYLRFVDYARRAVAAASAPTSSSATSTARATCSPPTCSGCSPRAAFRRLQTKINQFFRDPRTRRIFSFQAMYAGLAPHDALAIYAVIAYLDSVAGVYFPRGGIHAVPHGAGRRGREARRASSATAPRSTAGRDRGRPGHRR